LGDVYISDGLDDQYFFNEKDSDSKVYDKIKKILDKSSKQIFIDKEDEEDEED
jgi:hypothetical protein